MSRKVTILDLAKESGISKSTISRYLRGKNVSEEKRDKIEKAIKKCGYIRNNVAQLLRTSKSNLIGVLIPDLDNPFFTKIVKSIDELAQERNMTLIVKTFKGSRESEIRNILFVLGFMVEALFICRSQLDDETIQSLNIKIPVISLDKEFKVINSVVSNNFENGYLVTKHLYENVERNVMFFLRTNDSASIQQRLKGYEKYCDENDKKKFTYNYNRELGIDYDDLVRYINENDIEGIVCRNDNDAIKVLTNLVHLFFKGKIRRIKMCGFDNINLSNTIVPRLTTIDQKIDKMCEKAFDIFLNYEKYLEPKVYVHESELIIRESSL